MRRVYSEEELNEVLFDCENMIGPITAMNMIEAFEVEITHALLNCLDKNRTESLAELANRHALMIASEVYEMGAGGIIDFRDEEKQEIRENIRMHKVYKDRGFEKRGEGDE